MLRCLIGIARNPRAIPCAILLFVVLSVAFASMYSLFLPFLEGTPSLGHNTGGVARYETIGFVDCLYFSVTTQTTVGYGDIVATTLFGKILSMVQAVFGYFYMAFMISLFVLRAMLKTKTIEDILGHGRNEQQSRVAALRPVKARVRLTRDTIP